MLQIEEWKCQKFHEKTADIMKRVGLGYNEDTSLMVNT